MPSYRHSFNHVLCIFLDGVGIGPEHADSNPFARFELPGFARLMGNQSLTDSYAPIYRENHTVTSIDALLGIEGLPQSGTGQATLFTGINGAELAGRHFGPYPHSKTKPSIEKYNVFTQIKQLDLPHPAPTAFANAYPKVFFTAAASKNRWTVTTLSCINSGTPIRTQEHLHMNLAITADITRSAWVRKLDLPIDIVSEAQAATHLATISQQHPFTLYEYYLTDKAGHSQSFDKARDVLHSLDAFLDALLNSVDFENTLLVLTSDHGNLEDLSVKPHTYNPVPLIAIGKGAHRFHEAHSLMDVTPLIRKTLAT